MLGYSDALAPPLLADGRSPQRVVVGVTDVVTPSLIKSVVCDELPFVPVPLRLTVMAMSLGKPSSVSWVTLTPIAVQRPNTVRGGSFMPPDARRMLYPSSWYITGTAESMDVPIGVPVSVGLPNDPLNRYMGLGAVVANPTDVDVRISLIWEVLYTDAE